MRISILFLCAILQLELVVYCNQAPMEQVFTSIYSSNFWGHPESLSGSGSTLQQTAIIREKIPVLLKNLGITSILDAPCGDLNWIQLIDLSHYRYIGIDIVKELIDKNKLKFNGAHFSFYCLNVAEDPLPYADLILCRDLLVHFSIQDIKNTIKNFKKSGAQYFLTTSFTSPARVNKDIELGGWRPFNLQLPPFNFPQPILIINEGCTEVQGAYKDKSLCLWLLKDIELS